MYTRHKMEWLKHLDFFLIDAVCLHIAFILAYYIRFPGEPSPYSVEIYRNIIFIMTLIQLMASVLQNNHENVLKRGLYQETVSVVVLACMSLILTALFLYSTKTGEIFSRLLIYYTMVCFVVVDLPARLLWKKMLLIQYKKGTGKKFRTRRVFLYTNSLGQKELIESLQENMFESFEIEGSCLTDAPETEIQPEEAASFICRKWIDEVFIYLPGEQSDLNKFLNRCTEMGVTVHIVMDLGGITEDKQMLETIGGKSVLTVAYSFMSWHQIVIKRIMDIFGGAIGSVVTVLIGLIVGPIIYMKSPGPILFKQERIGKNGKKFRMYKFRSMVPDAEERKKEFLAENRIADGLMFKLDFDPRVIGNRIQSDGTRKTGIGEFIRKTSIDEFPQFFNVLKGDMSLVGTRPPTVDEWEKYEYHHRARLSMKPGITGLWQVSGRSEITDFEEIVKLDTEYITEYRLLRDVDILFKTVRALFTKKGAM